MSKTHFTPVRPSDNDIVLYSFNAVGLPVRKSPRRCSLTLSLCACFRIRECGHLGFEVYGRYLSNGRRVIDFVGGEASA